MSLEFLTAEQAISVLPDGEYVHTFRNPVGMMIGADWNRVSIESALRSTDVIRLTGAMARRLGHGIAINEGGRPLFIATDETKIAALEKAA